MASISGAEVLWILFNQTCIIWWFIWFISHRINPMPILWMLAYVLYFSLIRSSSRSNSLLDIIIGAVNFFLHTKYFECWKWTGWLMITYRIFAGFMSLWIVYFCCSLFRSFFRQFNSIIKNWGFPIESRTAIFFFSCKFTQSNRT